MCIVQVHVCSLACTSLCIHVSLRVCILYVCPSVCLSVLHFGAIEIRYRKREMHLKRLQCAF